MSEQELLNIIAELRTRKQEWQTVDTKRELDLKGNVQQAKFIKDIAAMANNGVPSYLVIGLEDKTFDSVGRLLVENNKNKINDLLADAIDPPIAVDYQEFSIDGNEYAVITIMGKNPPYIIARNIPEAITEKGQARVNKGTIFIRHEDSTHGASRAELEEIYGRRTILKPFENESAYAQELVLNKPDAWEHRLTAELLSQHLKLLDQDFADLNRGIHFRQTTVIPLEHVLDWVQNKFQDIINIMSAIPPIGQEDMMVAWGKLGEPGDAIAIKRAVDKFISLCKEMLNWEISLRTVRVPDVAQNLIQMLQGGAVEIFRQVRDFPDKLLFAIENPDEKIGDLNFAIHVTAAALPDNFSIELERVREALNGQF